MIFGFLTLIPVRNIFAKQGAFHGDCQYTSQTFVILVFYDLCYGTEKGQFFSVTARKI